VSWQSAAEVTKRHTDEAGEELDRIRGHLPRDGKVEVRREDDVTEEKVEGGEWVAAPPSRRGGPNVWPTRLAALKKNAGRWARFDGGKTASTGGVRSAAQKLGIEVEVQGRTEDGKKYVYVRVVEGGQ